MQISPRQWRTGAFGLVITTAWIAYYLSIPISQEERFSRAITELEGLQTWISELNEEVLSYNQTFAGGFGQDGLPFDDFVKSKKVSSRFIPSVNGNNTANEDEDEDEDESTAHLTKRTKSLYKTSYRRGEALYQLITGPTSCVPKTPWTDYNSLHSWGWNYTEYNNPADVNKVIGSIEGVLNSKGLDAGNFVDVKWVHAERSTHFELNYPPTGGTYNSAYNPTQGAIIAYRSFNPEYHIIHKTKPYGIKFPPGAPRPKLSQWSDVVWLTWKHLTTLDPQRQNLQWIVRLNIVNEDTNALISAALKADGVKSGLPPKWPGHTFRIPENPQPGPLGGSRKPFMAMLGSANVRGVAWLLAQHRGDEGFGGAKTVRYITVWDKSEFAGSAGTQASLLVRIGDVVQPKY